MSTLKTNPRTETKGLVRSVEEAGEAARRACASLNIDELDLSPEVERQVAEAVIEGHRTLDGLRGPRS